MCVNNVIIKLCNCSINEFYRMYHIQCRYRTSGADPNVIYWCGYKENTFTNFIAGKKIHACKLVEEVVIYVSRKYEKKITKNK
jgi:hypothetical protein